MLASGRLVFEDHRFREMIGQREAARIEQGQPPHRQDESIISRAQVLADAAALAGLPIGTKQTRCYRGGTPGQEALYEARFSVMPFGPETAVLIVLEDLTTQHRWAWEAQAVGRFQSALAQIGSLAVSGVPVSEIMNEAVKLTAEALDVELCKILIPRESDEHLYLAAGVGWREGLIGSLTVEGGTHSQAGYAIRERKPVVVRDLRCETRFTPSKLLSEHGGVAGMSVPMMVQDRVYGVMGAHCRRVRDFTDKELEFLCSMGNTIATVLDRWRREETQLELYRRLFDLAQDGIMLTDPKGILLEWNPAMERMTGWTRAEVIGKPPSFLKSGKHPPEFYERLEQAIRSGVPFAARFVNRRKDGSEFLVWESISPVKDPDGTIRYCLAILTDLTERERMFDALRHTEQLKLVGQLAGGILHEVRNPLIGIGSLATHLAEQASLDDSVRARCRLIAREAKRIDEILESHLTQLQPRPFNFRPCNLPELLEDTVALLGSQLQKAGIRIERELHPALPVVWASCGHLQQVWLNIIMNAIEAMPQGGLLSIRMVPARRGRDGVLITFQDSGPGITPEDLERIFEPFFTSGKAKGVGLGLTISRDIIERHGGQIVITSPPEAGARVEIWLPEGQDGPTAHYGLDDSARRR